MEHDTTADVYRKVFYNLERMTPIRIILSGTRVPVSHEILFADVNPLGTASEVIGSPDGFAPDDARDLMKQLSKIKAEQEDLQAAMRRLEVAKEEVSVAFHALCDARAAYPHGGRLPTREEYKAEKRQLAAARTGLGTGGQSRRRFAW
jgi:hypothetical protein